MPIVKPTVGGDNNAWGPILNAALDDLDGRVTDEVVHKDADANAEVNHVGSGAVEGSALEMTTPPDGSYAGSLVELRTRKVDAGLSLAYADGTDDATGLNLVADAGGGLIEAFAPDNTTRLSTGTGVYASNADKGNATLAPGSLQVWSKDAGLYASPPVEISRDLGDTTYTVFQVTTDGNVEIPKPGAALTLTSPDGTLYDLTVTNSGTLTVTARP